MIGYTALGLSTLAIAVNWGVGFFFARIALARRVDDTHNVLVYQSIMSYYRFGEYRLTLVRPDAVRPVMADRARGDQERRVEDPIREETRDAAIRHVLHGGAPPIPMGLRHQDTFNGSRRGQGDRARAGRSLRLPRTRPQVLPPWEYYPVPGTWNPPPMPVWPLPPGQGMGAWGGYPGPSLQGPVGWGGWEEPRGAPLVQDSLGGPSLQGPVDMGAWGGYPGPSLQGPVGWDRWGEPRRDPPLQDTLGGPSVQGQSGQVVPPPSSPAGAGQAEADMGEDGEWEPSDPGSGPPSSMPPLEEVPTPPPEQTPTPPPQRPLPLGRGRFWEEYKRT